MTSNAVTIIGTGAMGSAVAKRLLANNFRVTVYNRTRSRADALKEIGANIALDVLTGIESSEVILLFLSDYAAINSVLNSDSCLKVLRNKTVIQMGTIGPSESIEIEKWLECVAARYIEAPVLGSISEAESGKLIIMTGGDEAIVRDFSNIFNTLGNEFRHIGSIGTAASLKLALNQLIAGLTTTFSLSLGFVQHQGVSAETFMEVLRESALYAKTFDKKLQRMIDRDYENPNFSTIHLAKDVALFRKALQDCNLDLRALEAVERIAESTIAAGLGLADYSAVNDVVNPPYFKK